MTDEEIVFYGLSTCMWCKKTKKYLEELGLEFNIIWVNEQKGDDSERVRGEVKALNPDISYPTVKIGENVVVGYKPDKLKEAVDLWQAKQK
jgi:glutaredoxin-like protein NrdH